MPRVLLGIGLGWGMFKEMKREPGAEQSMLDCEKGSARVFMVFSSRLVDSRIYPRGPGWQALVNDASNRLAPADSGREGEQR